MVSWAHPSLLPKRQVDRLSRFCTGHCRVSHYFKMCLYVFPNFCPWWPWPLTCDLDIQTLPSDGPSAVPDIFHTQPKKSQTETAPKQSLAQFAACGNKKKIQYLYHGALKSQDTEALKLINRIVSDGLCQWVANWHIPLPLSSALDTRPERPVGWSVVNVE